MPTSPGGRCSTLRRSFSLVGRTEQLDDFVTDVNLMLGWPATLAATPVRTGRQDQQSDAETRSRWVPYEPDAAQLTRVREANHDVEIGLLVCATTCCPGRPGRIASGRGGTTHKTGKGVIR